MKMLPKFTEYHTYIHWIPHILNNSPDTTPLTYLIPHNCYISCIRYILKQTTCGIW